MGVRAQLQSAAKIASFSLLLFGALSQPAWAQKKVANSQYELQGDHAAKAAKALNAIQKRSYTIEREFCGVLYLHGGEIRASTPAKGEEATCTIRYADHTRSRIIATYHTHSSYSPVIDSEVPSRLDLSSTINSGLDDYVSTPGGRLWLVSADTKSVHLICDIGCLIMDPRFVKCPATKPRNSYDAEGLEVRKQTIALPCPT